MNVIEGKAPFADFGTGLGQGLQSLANMKLNEITKQKELAQRQKEFSQIPGLDPNFINAIAAISNEKDRGQVLKHGLSRAGNQEFANIISQAAGYGTSNASTSEGKPTLNLANANISPERLGEVIKVQQAAETNALKRSKEKRENYKQIKEFSKPYEERAHASRNTIKNSDIASTLALSGKARTGNQAALMKKLGLEDFGKNFTTQALEKVLADETLNVAGAFGPGARITNFLEQSFQKTLPTIWNTDLGIYGLSQIRKRAAQVRVMEDEVRANLLKTWGGDLPYNADDIVKQTVDPERKRLDKEAYDIAANMAQQADYGRVKFGKDNAPLTLPYDTYDDGKPVMEKDIVSDNGKTYIREGGRWRIK